METILIRALDVTSTMGPTRISTKTKDVNISVNTYIISYHIIFRVSRYSEKSGGLI